MKEISFPATWIFLQKGDDFAENVHFLCSLHISFSILFIVIRFPLTQKIVAFFI